jgi:mannose-6-phosphate isomerase class I
MEASATRGGRTGYEREPRYPVAGGRVELGYESLAAELVAGAVGILALDGAAALPWEELIDRLVSAVERAGRGVQRLDLRHHHAPWPAVEARTVREPLRDDPVYASVHEGPLTELFAELPTPTAAADGSLLIVFGPGAGLVAHDRLWFADLPKRMATERIEAGSAANLGQAPGAVGDVRRLMFIDWPMLDRHKREQLQGWDRYLDLRDPAQPASLSGEVLRASLAALAAAPFRTRPSFAPGPWGGQWMRRTLGIPSDGSNLAWSYELIAPESSVLLDDGQGSVEVGFELLMAAAGQAILGDEVHERFGASFPIRFDYLDTVDGGHLSVHCHPREEYMRDVFGWPYTQHETYYLMATTPGARIFLALRADADLDAFAEAAERSQRDGAPLEIERWVDAVPARQHGLYLIPAGTPHASSEGNVVLEVSATPYLYSLRFYDWLRADLDGTLRPVQLHHAFANLEPRRRGAAASGELVPDPVEVRSGAGSRELDLGGHPELFFAVHRLEFDEAAHDDTAGRFHVLNLVEGDEIEIQTDAGAHRLTYAETILVPASVGRYRLEARAGGPFRVVKAFVRPAARP